MGYTMISLYQFLSGATMFGALVGCAYFMRFWRRSGDRLFLSFGLAFGFMALERLILAFISDPEGEDHSIVYLIRLAAFVLILWAIVEKNRSERAR
jgi:hypothetical protein